MENLTAQTAYNVSAMIISSRNIVYNLGTQTFTTMKLDFHPEKITDIQIVGFEPIFKTDRIGVVFKWEPARDETCKYEIIVHDPKNENDSLHVTTKNYPEIYHYSMEIGFDREISVSVRGINEIKLENENFMRKESNISWITLEIPTCMHFYHNRSICNKPEEIVDLNSTITNVGYYLYDIKVFWRKPLYNPEYYTLEIYDINTKKNDNDTVIEFYSYEVNENETSFEIQNVKMTGMTYYVKLTAHIGNETVVEFFHYPRSTPNDFKKQNLMVPIVILIIASTITIIMVSILIYNQYQFKEKLNENMDLDLIKSITNRSVLEAIDELTKDELMEIDRDNIKILEALGEGAFGYVKKGIVIKDDVKLEVAVKMLKSK
jgi:tyrosine-protein kinase receptor torso